jgi:Fuc2NAc and GlcNAc transferase
VAIGLVWLLNLYNFMDGIDGIAASEAICVAIGIAFISSRTEEHHGIVGFALVIAASCSGFLVWNWPPARIFMGDSGSGFLGFGLGSLAIYSMQQGKLPIQVPLILLAVFVTDASVTLTTRLLQGCRISEAHRSHAYQRLARRWGSHKPVVIGTIIVNVIWLWPLCLAVLHWPAWSGLMLLLAYVPLIVLAVVAGAGRPDDGRPALT